MSAGQDARPRALPWGRAEAQLLVALWAEGLSARIIAERLNAEFRQSRTANAVIGFAERRRQFCPVRDKHKQKARRAPPQTVAGEGLARVAAERAVAKPAGKTPRRAPAAAELRPRAPTAALPVAAPPAAPALDGVRLADCAPRGCRYPVNGTGVETLFCNFELSRDDWQPGRVGGCYCAAHRRVARSRAPSPAERAARVANLRPHRSAERRTVAKLMGGF